MGNQKPVNILAKYFFIFIGFTILLFIIYKFVPITILKKDYPGTSINVLGLRENDFFQYFYFLYALITGKMGNVNTLLYSGTVKSAVSIILPETIFFLVITFLISYALAYLIGFYSGTTFRTVRRLSMSIFPLLFLYMVSGLTLVTVFSGILGWFPSGSILSIHSIIGHSWISYSGQGLFITSPTNIIILDSIIHNSPVVLFDYLKHMVLPFIALLVPTTIYLSVYISHEASIEYNSSFMRAGTTRDAFRDNYILYVKRGIRSRLLEELKPVFLIFMGGLVLISFIFSYMNLGEFAVYSFMNYNFGFMGGLYSVFMLAIIVIIFDAIIDLLNREVKHAD
ncbi:ABC transporter permease family protein [Ferroplasma acidarmanus]|uniref:Oligopeptide ABC transporter Dpp2, permease protein n=1 Tax=Ferroplasma acidarmanus Fer1 TaxID=333146 RepID=S0ASM8_FERAC|nr:peptide ABC transporter permease [Ferroplasma acidarmanus]AGO61049.1 oligopeptide ABC transporter Dpp2, permease protein [Ferroplasma acidarmanus Fer1]